MSSRFSLFVCATPASHPPCFSLLRDSPSPFTDPIYRQIPPIRAKSRPHSNKRCSGNINVIHFIRKMSSFLHFDHVRDAVIHTAQLFKFKTDQANDLKLIEKLNKVFCCLMSAPQPTVDLLIGLFQDTHAFLRGHVMMPYAHGFLNHRVTMNDHDIFSFQMTRRSQKKNPLPLPSPRGAANEINIYAQ
jgi:hypothetical protein